MISGGNVTIYVASMERAVRFYTETLGFKLRVRHGDHWAEVDAGDGLILGLHPASPSAPKPGTAGSLQIGFGVDGKLEDVVAVLENRGVAFHGAIKSDGPTKLAFFSDPDGNPLYLAESAVPG